MGNMKGGRAVVSALEELDTKIIFGIPGLHILTIYDALYDSKKIKHVTVKHECNAGFMADAYGRLTGEPGVCITTAGPGACNVVNSIAQAYSADSPLLHICGTNSLDSLAEFLHGVDIPNFLQLIFKPITKASILVNNAKDIPKTLFESYNLAKSNRKGPVHIEIPINVLGEEISFSIKIKLKSKVENDEKIKRFAEILSLANYPVILAGKGVLRAFAWEELINVAKLIKSPIIVSYNYPDIIPFDHELHAGFFCDYYLHPASQFALNISDVILCVGVRVSSTEAKVLEKFTNKRILFLDYEDRLANKATIRNVSDILNLDVKRGLMRLKDELGRLKVRVKNEEVLKKIKEIKRATVKRDINEVKKMGNKKPIHVGYALLTLKKFLDRDAIVTADAGTTTGWARECMQIYEPNTYLEPGMFGSMGFSFPAAIAAKLIYTNRQVVSITGDGGFLMSLMEISTALENNLNLVIVITNDSKYGNIWLLQKDYFNSRYIGVNLNDVNYAKLAESFGAKGIRVEEPNELEQAFKDALNSSKITVVDIVTDHRYSPIIKGELSEDDMIKKKYGF
jgi:acetolactate synthase-1/2/3 large subunit